jgi:integrase
MEVTTERKTVFDVDSSTRDALFRKAKVKANVTGLTFHDTRREACTRLAKIYGVMELAKISGHKKLSILLNTYYSPSIDDLADKLE